MAIDFDQAARRLNDPKQGEREAALRDLYVLKTEAAIILIGEKVVADRSKSVRLLAANLLANIGGEKEVGFFVKALKDPEMEIRKIAITALGPIADADTCRKVLLPLLENRLVEIRKTAIDALCHCPNMDSETEARFLDFLKERLESSDKDERLEALTELSSFKTGEIIDLIGNKIFKDRSKAVKEKAAEILAFKFGGEEVKDCLLRALTSKNLEIQKITVIYLGTVADGEICKDILLPLLEHDSDQLKATAIAALCNRYREMDEESQARYVTFIEDNLISDDVDVWGFSARALSLITPENYIDRFIDLLTEKDYLHFILSKHESWYWERPEYRVKMPGLINIMIDHADQEQLEKIIHLLALKIEATQFGIFHFQESTAAKILNSFTKSSRITELFAILKQCLLRTSRDRDKTAWINSLAYLLDGYLSLYDNTPMSEEYLQDYPWIKQNLNPTIELFKELLQKQNQKSIEGNWWYFEDFLRRHKVETFKANRNKITRYFVPWLQLYGVDGDEIKALLPTVTGVSRRSGTRKSPKKRSKINFAEFKVPVIEEKNNDSQLTSKVVEKLSEQLLNDENVDLRLSAGLELSQIDSELIYRYMLKASGDSAFRVRELAWNYIARFDCDETYHNMLIAIKDKHKNVRMLAADFLGHYPEKDTENILEELIIPALKEYPVRLTPVLRRYNIKRTAKSLFNLLAEYGKDDFFNTSAMDLLSLFSKMTPAIAAENISHENAENIFHYLKKFYSNNNPNKWSIRQRASEQHISIMQYIFPLIEQKRFPEMEKIMADIFIKGKISSSPFDMPFKYLQPIICMAAGKAQHTERFFELIVEKTRSGGNYSKAMGIIFLMPMVGGDLPGYENWGVHLDETISLFTEILDEREGLPYYRGTEDEQYNPYITGDYETGFFLTVKEAVKKSRKKIKTPRKHDIFERNLTPWLEAKKSGKK